MAKTIADLGQHSIHTSQPEVNRAVPTETDERAKILKQIKALEDQANQENIELEQGGYDYNGHEAWAAAMERIGRK